MLDLLTASKKPEKLASQLQTFLLCCKVDELSPATLHDYHYKLNVFIKFCEKIGVRTPTEITTNHIRHFLLELRERNSPYSVLDYFKVIKRFFNWLVDEGQLSQSPMSRMKSPRVPERVIVPFTLEHINRLLAVCDTQRFLGARNKATILVLLDTGLRRSELAQVQIDDVDFDRETIKVIGKGAKERVVRIGKKTQKALLTYLLMRDDNYPCLWVTEERRPLQSDGVRQMLEVVGQQAGLGNVRCSAHTFRHTFATQALINGAGEFNVQSLLGHSDLRMTRRYSATLRSEHAVEAHRKFSPVDRLLK